MHTEEPRGAWRHDSDIDHGLAGGINAAVTIVADDPIFGWVAYGGKLENREDRMSVFSRDGIRRRFQLVSDETRLDLELRSDGFASQSPIEWDPSLTRLSFALENRLGTDHQTMVQLRGLPKRVESVTVDGEPGEFETASDGTTTVMVAMKEAQQIANVEIRSKVD